MILKKYIYTKAMPIEMTESELQDRIAIFLSKYFTVEKEVWSEGFKKRIDIAMIHKTDILKLYPIGIEIKTFDKKTGSDAGKWLKQASHYSELEFIGYGKMLIIVAPQFSENAETFREWISRTSSQRINIFRSV